MTTHPRYISSAFFVAAFVLATAGLHATSAYAATICAFSTDLKVGSESDAVKCLQQYLNAHGFTVSASGVGSVGHETTQFKAKTEAAVKAWQTANGVTPVTGTFGSKSRAKYMELMAAASTPTTTPTTTPVTTPTSTPSPTTTTSTDTSAMTNARKVISKAHDSYDSVKNDYENAHEDGDNTGSAKTNLSDAQDKLMAALYAYVSGDYGQAAANANDAQNLINTASQQIDGKGGTGSRDDARSAIKKAKDDFNAARNKVNDADDRGKSTSRADNYLNQAQSSISDAQDSYDSKDYNDAINSTKEAASFVKKALAAI